MLIEGGEAGLRLTGAVKKREVGSYDFFTEGAASKKGEENKEFSTIIWIRPSGTMWGMLAMRRKNLPPAMILQNSL